MRPYGPLMALFVSASAFLLACESAAPPGPIAGTQLVASPSERQADGNAAIDIEVAARDGLGAVLPGVTVLFAVTPNGPVLASPVGLTDADGLATTSLTSAVAGNFVVSAQLLINGTYIATPSPAAVRFVDEASPAPLIGAAASTKSALQIYGSNTAGALGGMSVGVSVRDPQGIALSNVPVTLTSSVASDVITPASAKTTSYGIATLQLAATAAGTRTLKAVANGLTLKRSVSIVAGNANTNNSTLSLAPNTLLLGNGSVAATLDVVIVDDYFNPLANQFVSLSCSPSCFVGGNTVLTGSDGSAQTTAGAYAGGNMTFAATSGAVSLSLTQAFLQPLVTGVTLGQSGLLAAPLSAVTATLQAATPVGYAQPYASFVLSSPSPDVSFSPSRGITDANGLATSTVTFSLAGNDILLALVGGNQLAMAPLAATAQINACPNAGFRLPVAPSIALDNNAVPAAVVAADFTGDGAQDLAVIDQGSPPRLWVLLNDGSDGYTTRATYALLGNAYGIAAGALRSAGVIDLVVTASDGNSVVVWLNQGDGTFVAGPTLVVGSAPAAVTIADFDQDGVNDIAVANSRDDATGNSVTVWFNDGGASFSTSTSVPVGHAPIALASGLINNDALVDLVVAHSHENLFDVVLGSPNRTFSPAQTYALSSNATGIALGDLNGDGTADVAVTTSASPFVHTYASDVNGALTALGNAMTTASLPSGAMRGVAVSDVNADGKLDVIVADAGLRVWLGDGHGNLAPSLHYGGLDTAPSLASFAAAAGAPNARTVIAPSAVGHELFAYQHLETESVAVGAVMTGAAARDFAASDITGDGQSDLVVPDFASTNIKLFASSGNTLGGSYVPLPGLVAHGNVTAVVVAGFTGAGHADIAAINPTQPGLDVFAASGNGTFRAAKNTPLGSVPLAVAAADIDNDGLSDVVLLGMQQNQLMVLRATGGGNVAALASYATVANAALLAIGDVNGDGLPDVVVAGNGSDANLYVHLNNNGTLLPAQLTALPSAPVQMALADLNADGVLDIVVLLPNQVSYLRGNNSGRFLASQALAIAPLNGVTTAGLIVSDVSGDAIPDVVWAAAGVLGVATNDGTGNLTLHPDSFVLSGARATLRLSSIAVNDVLVPLFTSDNAPYLVPLPFAGCPG